MLVRSTAATAGLLILILFAGTTTLLAVACSDSDTDGGPTLRDPANDGGGGQTNADATGATDDASKPYTLDDVCTRTAPLVCDVRKPCCEKDVGFDLAACLTHTQAECEKDVADVRAGKATFHPERIDGCLPKLADIVKSCTLTFDLLPKLGRDLAACRIFEGQKPLGETCERASQCVGPSGPKEIASCDDDTKTCKMIKIVASGARCSIGAASLNEICDEGLYCDITAIDAGVLSGTCATKTALGQPCNASKKDNLECGLGNFCHPTNAVCTVGSATATPCENNLECGSVRCEAKNPNGPDAGRACKPLDPITKPAECGKP